LVNADDRAIAEEPNNAEEVLHHTRLMRERERERDLDSRKRKNEVWP
jgi:hypothetical protein